MAKAPKKQATPKTPEQTMDELTELSQELGLYDITDNPLIKDTPRSSQEATGEHLQSIEGESNTVVLLEAQNVLDNLPEGLNETGELEGLLNKVTEENKHEEIIPTVSDKFTLKDGWGQLVPTKLVVIQSMNYTDLISQTLFAGYLGSQLDRSFRIMSTVPFRIRVLMPEDQYENFLSKESQVVFDENLAYNKVLVKSYDLYRFWEHIINIGKEGGIVKPRHVAQKRPMYMVPILTRAPLTSSPEHRVGREKVKYTRNELENFSLESLKACGSWYGISSSNSKLKYVKAILEAQEE